MAQYTSYSGKTYDTLVGGNTFQYQDSLNSLDGGPGGTPLYDYQTGNYIKFKDSTTGQITADFYDELGQYKTSLNGYEGAGFDDVFSNFINNAYISYDFKNLFARQQNSATQSLSADGYDAIKLAEKQFDLTKNLQDYTFGQDKEFEQIQLDNAITLGQEQLANTKDLNAFNFTNDVAFENLQLENAISLGNAQLANTQALNASNLQNDITFEEAQKNNALEIADRQLQNTMTLNQSTLANDIAFEDAQLQNAISLASNQLANDKDFAAYTDELTKGQSAFNSELSKQEARFTSDLNRENKEFSIATARDAYGFGSGSIGSGSSATSSSRRYDGGMA